MQIHGLADVLSICDERLPFVSESGPTMLM